MNKLVYIAGVGFVFALGFYAGHQYSDYGSAPKLSQVQKMTEPTAMPADAHRAGVPGDGGLTSMPVHAATNVESGTLSPPPHQQSQGAVLEEPAQPSPEDIARQDEAHAEMIASMRANGVPEDHIAKFEEAYATKKQNDAQLRQQGQKPMAERSTAELADELEQTLRQSGAPEEDIKAMVQSMYRQVAFVKAAQANAQPSNLDSPMIPGIPEQSR